MSVFVCPRLDATLDDVLAGSVLADASLVADRDSYMRGAEFGLVHRGQTVLDLSREPFTGSGPHASYYEALRAAPTASVTLAAGFFRTAHAVFQCDGDRAWQVSHAPAAAPAWCELGGPVPLCEFATPLLQQCFRAPGVPLEGFLADRFGALLLFYKGYCLFRATRATAPAIRCYAEDWSALPAPVFGPLRLAFPDAARYCQVPGFPLCALLPTRIAPVSCSHSPDVVLAKAQDSDAMCYLHVSESPVRFALAAGPWFAAENQPLACGAAVEIAGSPLTFYIGSEGLRGALGSPPVARAIYPDRVDLRPAPELAAGSELLCPRLLGTPFLEMHGELRCDGAPAYRLDLAGAPVYADAPSLELAARATLPDGEYAGFRVANYAILRDPAPRQPRWPLALLVIVLVLAALVTVALAAFVKFEFLHHK